MREEECLESIMVLYYMAKSIEADIEVTLVRWGREEYNVQLRVKKDLSGAYEIMNGHRLPASQSSSNMLDQNG